MRFDELWRFWVMFCLALVQLGPVKAGWMVGYAVGYALKAG